MNTQIIYDRNKSLDKISNIMFYKEKTIHDIEINNNSINYINNNKNIKRNLDKIGHDYYKYNRNHIIKYLIIIILLFNFNTINSNFNIRINRINTIIFLSSYEIILRVKNIGLKKILSSSSSNIYPCPSYIYLNDELIHDKNDCHYINIVKPYSEIKMIWNNIIINSTKGMFYNCNEIAEINMTNFDTSLVTDMSEMFSLCHSLNYLNVSNFNTEKVESFTNMFFKCTSITSINLESFTNPSAISLYRMFYGCEKLEYINIKNFEERKNMNLAQMFYNIAQNAVICFLSCPPPANFTISSITATQAEISWEKYEWNKFIISYDLQNLTDPENGNKIYITDKTSYKFTNLIPLQRYDIFIKTDCGNKFSYWIGPLLLSIESYIMANIGSDSITTCSKAIYDSGGPDGNYEKNASSLLHIYPEKSGQFLSIQGKAITQPYHGYFRLYYGLKKGYYYEYHWYTGNYNIPLYVSPTGPLSIELISDSDNVNKGLHLTIGCIINVETIYNLIKKENCQIISCDKNWKKKQNLIDSDTEICVKNCNITDNKYQYRGKCYNNCPINTINDNFNNFMCYSNSVIEKCENYSIESEYDDLCVKCNEDYYPKLNDKTNKYDFINCYKNNHLEKYYLDNNDLLFKPCYKSCKTCNQYGTEENHNCLTCAESYYYKYEDEHMLQDGKNINCYQKLDGYYLYKNKYFKKCYLSCDLCEKEGNDIYHNCIKCNSEYFYELNMLSYLNCYNKCKFNYYYDEFNQKYFCTPDNNCVNYYDKLIYEKNQCVNDCKKNPNFPFEFKKKCYSECPKNISEISKEKKFFCEIKCSKDLPFKLFEIQECVDNCTLSQMKNKICELNYRSNNKTEMNEILEKMIENIKRELTNDIDISEVYNWENIIIQEEDIVLTLIKYDEQKKNINSKMNTTIIDLKECEKKIKKNIIFLKMIHFIY